MAHESSFAEMLMSDARYSDTFSRLLYELTSRPNKVTAARGVWGIDFNLVMPGRHFTIQASEIRVFYDSKWTKVPADTDGESKRKALLVEFMKDRVKEYKTSSRAMMVTGATAPPAAILIKKSGEKVPQLKMLRIDLIPDVVFVPAFTVLSLIGVRILNVTRTTRDTP
ncbi:hypothetical protein GW17_00021986 [Ensete ventricosum]|nr:hypothetical protein GW17_00021986 [Ensete ventricosum]